MKWGLKNFLIIALLLAACDSELAISPTSQRLKKPTIETLNKVSAKPGDQISFFGKNLSADIEISVGGIPAAFILDDESKGSFIVPEGVESEAGLMQVSFSVKSKSKPIVKFPVIDSDAVDSVPTVPVPEENACSTLVYKNVAGELVRGKASCVIVPPCTEDGETGCSATAAVPATPRVDLATKLATGVTFGDVTGTACSVDDSPLATLSGQPVGPSNSLNLNVTVAGDGVTHYRYKLRENTDAACSVALGYSSERSVLQAIDDDITALADGQLQLCVIGKDAEGKWQMEGSASAASWIKDTLAPTALLSNVPTGTNNSNALNASVAGTDVTQYKYKIRDPLVTACSDSADYGPAVAVGLNVTDSLASFAEGSLEICVIGRDAAGNWQAEGAATTAGWTKDTLAPSATISGAPTGTNNTTILNVTIAGADVSRYKYKIRTAADAACSATSGYSADVPVGIVISSDISALSDGTMELCVIGRDVYGNWQSEATAASASWTKDALPPAATLSGAPTGSSLSTGLNITVAGTDVVEYKYKIREASDLPCSNSTGYGSAIAVATHITDNISAKADGTIEVCVIGKDAMGNWQLEGMATIASWTKDTAAPTATIVNAPMNTNNTTLLDITVTGTAVTHYKYKIREAADAACSVAVGYSAELGIAAKITDNISALAEGALEVCVVGRDSAGNWQTEAAATTASWTKDTAAPTATISGAPAGTSGTTTLNVTIAGAGVTHYKFKARDSSDLACSNATGYSAEVAVATAITSDISALGDGSVQLCVIGRDAAGNWQTEASASTAAWTKDALPPVATLSGQPTGSSNSTTLDITVAGADVVEYKYKIRTSSDLACSNSAGYSTAVAVATHITDNISALADGSIQVCVLGKDSVGNWQLEGVASTATWTKDIQPSSATITDAPTGTNATTILNVTIAGTDITHYKYKVREPATTACSNSADYSAGIAAATKITDNISALPDGTVELCVIGQDAAGNWQTEASATTVSWTKDMTAPTATISAAPTGTNAATTLNVTIAGTDVTHYKYKIRSTADAACSSSAGYSPEVAVGTSITDSVSSLSDGVLQLCVIGRDNLNNWQTEASATTASWTKDTTAPVATLSGAPGAFSNVTSLDITIASTDVVEYKYKIRVAATSACSNSTGYSSAVAVATHISDDISALADGAIEVCVIGKDSSGNWQAEANASAATWTKDTAAPTASIGNAPTGTNSTAVLDITVAGAAVSHYKYKIREPADAACSVAAGYSTEIAVATKITDNISAYDDGILELCVIGKDSAGNWQAEASATAASWTKDTTAPTATISGEPTGTNNTTTLNVTIAGTGVTHYKYKIRESADTACSDSTGYSSEVAVATAITDSISSKADGTIQLCIIGRDTYGNWQAEASATTVSWTKDTTPSTATLSGQPTGSSLVTVLNVTVGGTDITEYKYKIRVPADAACSSTTGYSSAIAVASHITDDISGKADGTIEICVIGKDGQGNWQLEASATSATWTKDTIAPTATISGEPTGTNSTTTLNISIAGTAVTEYKYKIRESATTACSNSSGYSSSTAVASPISDSISSLSDGTIEICVIGRDAAGNYQLESAASAASWTKDTTAPTAALSGAPTGSSRTTVLDITVSGTDVIEYKYKIRENASTACSNSSGYSAAIAVATHITDDISSKAEGTIEVCVIGKDSYGNWQLEASAGSASWTKDTTAAPDPATFSVSPRESALKAGWTSGGGDTSGYLVLRRATTAINDAPTSGTTYIVGATIGSSTVAYVGSSLLLSDTSLTNGTKYNYKIFAYDAAKNYSPGLSAAARPVSYEPPSADNLLFWTDASYTDSLFTDSGCATAVTAANETVGCLKDLTSYAAVLTQAASGNRPVYKTSNVYGHPGMQHANSHWLSAVSTNIPSGNLQHSLVYIGSFGDTTTSGAIHIGGTLFDSKIRFFGHSGSWLVYSFGGNDLAYTPPAANPQLFIGTYNGVDGTTTNRKLYLNGVENTSVGNAGIPTNTLNLPANPGVTIGSDSTGTENLTGDVGEFLLYDHDLSASEIVELSRYAWNKWSIPQIALSLASTPSSLVLTWTDGTASSSYLLVRRAGSTPTFTPTSGVSYNTGAQGADTIVYVNSALTYTDSSVSAGTTYYYALYANDGSNNYRPAISTSGKVLESPNPLSVATNDAKLDLSWGAVAEASGYLIVRKDSGAPTFAPNNGSTYATGAQGSDTVIYVGNGTSVQDTGLTNGTTYHYKIYAYDSSHNYASATSASGTPAVSCSITPVAIYSNTNYSVPSGCTKVTIQAWGGGGGAGGHGGGTIGAGGAGGYSSRANVAVSAGQTIAITIGAGGKSGLNSGACTFQGGSGYSTYSGGNGGGTGAAGGGSGGGTGGNGSTAGMCTGSAGGAGGYGGGGGGGTTLTKGGGGGGATGVEVNGSLSVIAGGGGGGGADYALSGGAGGPGCSVNGSNASGCGGGGGGGGACTGASTQNGSGRSPYSGAGADPEAYGFGGDPSSTGCVAASNGTSGKVILTFGP